MFCVISSRYQTLQHHQLLIVQAELHHSVGRLCMISYRQLRQIMTWTLSLRYNRWAALPQVDCFLEPYQCKSDYVSISTLTAFLSGEL